MSVDDQLLLSIPTSKSEPSSSTESSPSPNPLLHQDTQQTQSEMHTPASSSASTHTTESTSSSSPTSTSALPSVNVKFAPLPEIAPRKRRSTAPLGMAARGQLMRRRRGHYSEQQQLLQQQERERIATLEAHRTPEELEQHRLMQEAVAAQFAVYQASAAAQAAREEEAELELMESELESGGGDKRGGSRRRRKRGGGGRSAGSVLVVDDDDDDLGDPFHALGKTLKGASKSFWRKVSHKDGHPPEGSEQVTPKGKEVTRRKSDVCLHSRPSEMASSSSQPPLALAPLRPILATIRSNSNIAAAAAKENNPEPKEKEEVGGVWEEAIGDAFPLNVSQTETIIEGRPVKSSLETPPPVKAPVPPTPISVVVVKSPISKTSSLRKGKLLKP